MVTRLAIYLNLYLATSTGLDSMSGATVSVVAVPGPGQDRREEREDHPPPPGTGGVPTNKRGQ